MTINYEYYFESGKVVYSAEALTIMDLAVLIARFGDVLYCGKV